MGSCTSPCTHSPLRPQTPPPELYTPAHTASSQPSRRGKWAEMSDVTERGPLFPSTGQTSSPGAGGCPCWGTRELLGQLFTHSKQGPGPRLHARLTTAAKLTWKEHVGLFPPHTPATSLTERGLGPHSDSQSATKKPASLSQTLRERPPPSRRPATDLGGGGRGDGK